MERDGPRRGDAGTVLGWELGKQEWSPEVVCEELAGRGNPAAFALPFQLLPSPGRVTSPQPCSRHSRSGGASQRSHKAKVSSAEGGWTCCPEGWKNFQQSCYYISDDTMSWAESVQNCTGMGSHLVVINSKAEQVFLSIFLELSSIRPNFYIGLRAEKVGEWHWVDQTPFNVFWRKGEPTNTDAEKCVVIHILSAPAYNWNDVKCGNYYRICEAAAVTV
uniref:C-type lectin domain-containing protein n=1 Tax=Athene cunicularia TaxID=194338 RepID=A0A663LT41_ATHCN